MVYVTIAICAGMLLAAPLGRFAARRLFGELPEGVSTSEVDHVLSAGAWRRSAILTSVGIFGGVIALSALVLLITIVANIDLYPTLTFAPMIPAFLALHLSMYRLRRLASFEALNRRGERSVCTRCNYVLAGSVSAQCPECGHTILSS